MNIQKITINIFFKELNQYVKWKVQEFIFNGLNNKT